MHELNQDVSEENDSEDEEEIIDISFDLSNLFDENKSIWPVYHRN